MKKISTQYGLLFSGQINRPDIVASTINDEFPELFDGVPLNLPLPPDAPPEIISSQLKSSNEKWKLSISKVRLDLVRQLENKEDEINTRDLENMLKIILLCFDKIKEQLVDVNRIVNLANYMILEENPVEFIQEKLSVKKFLKTKDLKIRFNQQESLNDNFNINNISIIENGKLKKEEIGDINKEIILIQRDINTRHDMLQNFPKENVNKFFKLTDLLLDEKEVLNFFS